MLQSTTMKASYEEKNYSPITNISCRVVGSDCDWLSKADRFSTTYSDEPTDIF